jgi:hypothetical protein
MTRRSLLFALPLLLALAACGGPAVSADAEARLQNPLYAQRYWAELVDRMTMMQIQKDPLLEDAGKAAVAESTKQDALTRERAADAEVRKGLNGVFIPIKEATEGQVLLLDGTLWFGTTFVAYPGPDLHVFLTAAVDPRDVAFPDSTALDLGLLTSPYGDQKYVLPASDKDKPFRTAVLWDVKLGRLYGFAQLAK